MTLSSFIVLFQLDFYLTLESQVLRFLQWASATYDAGTRSKQRLPGLRKSALEKMVRTHNPPCNCKRCQCFTKLGDEFGQCVVDLFNSQDREKFAGFIFGGIGRNYSSKTTSIQNINSCSGAYTSKQELQVNYNFLQ